MAHLGPTPIYRTTFYSPFALTGELSLAIATKWKISNKLWISLYFVWSFFVLTNKTVSKHFSNHFSCTICILVNVLIADLFYLLKPEPWFDNIWLTILTHVHFVVYMLENSTAHLKCPLIHTPLILTGFPSILPKKFHIKNYVTLFYIKNSLNNKQWLKYLHWNHVRLLLKIFGTLNMCNVPK